ncbi:MAG: alpha/beta fold hydrolase [Crocinitomicaceae bacterium]|nr:alpha/beta fold hydrolase [Flavobacteriales bacterium]NQZ38086.1 alpha/beta fold hydrolase [Crocinitomicaceae bacterium]
MNKFFLLMGLISISISGVYSQSQSETATIEFKKVDVLESKMAYWEKGAGDPILFLHGVPTNSLLWRNIAPQLDTLGRAISVDLIGYGKSEIPKTFDYSIQTQYEYLEAFIDSLQLKNITLVLHDFGSLLGLKYANEHPDNIKAIVLMESLYMPAEAWYNQLTFSSKAFFWIVKKPKRANNIFVKKSSIYSTMISTGTNRKLSDSEMSNYTDPYENEVGKRTMVLKGSPATQMNKGISKFEGDFPSVLNKTANDFTLISDSIPILLFYSNPGMINKSRAIEYAQKHFLNLKLVELPKGKHFFPEDFPNEISHEIAMWYKQI